RHDDEVILRQVTLVQNRLFDFTKFDNLVRYRCANLFFLVLPGELYDRAEIPLGWRALVETNASLDLVQKPALRETCDQVRLRLLQRIAAAGTRLLNRQLQITFEEVLSARSRAG